MSKNLRIKQFHVGLVFGAVSLTGLWLSACGDDHDKAKTCDPSATDSCSDQEACVLRDGDFVCESVCAPQDIDACAGGQVCERLTSGKYACFDPVLFKGRVFDADSDEGIEDADVVGADAAGIVVTNVARTDADGRYALAVPVTRDASGTPQASTYTLRVAAQGYQPYPYGIRPAIPVDVSSPARTDEGYEVSNPTTDVALIPLEGANSDLGSVSGRIQASNPGGALVVAEGGDVPAPMAFADIQGDFRIFNVPAGTYTVRGYKAFLQLDAPEITLQAAEDVSDVLLAEQDRDSGTLAGQVTIVNAPGGLATSVVLVPESTFMDTFVRGVVPPGLRDPAPGIEPDVTGDFLIEGVPDGTYVVLAAFENDDLVRDPDPAIAGTQIVHVTMDSAQQKDMVLDQSFKITEALAMVGPGADGPEAVDPAETLVFEWADDSSEDFYSIVVYDAYGNMVWNDDHVARVTGPPTVQVTYAGPALEPGMYYQWRATSHRNSGPISTTEDLRGVFFVPSAVR